MHFQNELRWTGPIKIAIQNKQWKLLQTLIEHVSPHSRLLYLIRLMQGADCLEFWPKGSAEPGSRAVGLSDFKRYVMMSAFKFLGCPESRQSVLVDLRDNPTGAHPLSYKVDVERGGDLELPLPEWSIKGHDYACVEHVQTGPCVSSCATHKFVRIQASRCATNACAQTSPTRSHNPHSASARSRLAVL